MLRTLYGEDSSRMSRRGRTTHNAKHAVKVRKLPYAPYVEQWPVIMPSLTNGDSAVDDKQRTHHELGEDGK